MIIMYFKKFFDILHLLMPINSNIYTALSQFSHIQTLRLVY